MIGETPTKHKRETMKAYIFQAALLCEGCALDTIAHCKSLGTPDDGDSDRYPQGPYANGGGESDCPEHCDHCRGALDNPLTEYGALQERIKAETREPWG
jgi:hypothetical protein